MSWKTTAAWQAKTFKPDALRVGNALNKAGILYTLEWREPRYEKDGSPILNRDGRPKFYSVDILVHDHRFELVGIEMEGDHSASKDNQDRDDYLRGLGIWVLHEDNRVPAEKVLEDLQHFRKHMA